VLCAPSGAHLRPTVVLFIGEAPTVDKTRDNRAETQEARTYAAREARKTASADTPGEHRSRTTSDEGARAGAFKGPNVQLEGPPGGEARGEPASAACRRSPRSDG
jgi:hypothetical protein